MQLRSKLIRLRLGLQTILGLKRSGFFIPYARAGSVVAYEHANYPHLKTLFDSHRNDFSSLLEKIDGYGSDLLKIHGLAPPQPRFEQDWFPRLDAAAHYTMTRACRPKRIIEVGSGHSTRWMCRALDDEGVSAQFTAIDPQPRADIAQLPVKLVQSTPAGRQSVGL